MKQEVMYSRCKAGLSPVKRSILSWPKKCWDEDAKPKWHRHCSDDHAGIIPLPDWPFNLHLWIIVPTTLICSSQYVCLTWHLSSFGNCLEDVFELFVELISIVLPCLCKECKYFFPSTAVSHPTGYFARTKTPEEARLGSQLPEGAETDSVLGKLMKNFHVWENDL